ncbi:MAG: DUF3857 domain-containing protein [Cyclobacteriaceae bacterium]|nr:DUF3857 domain-containing protein [Cyclobacteriaceae bacterium]
MKTITKIAVLLCIGLCIPEWSFSQLPPDRPKVKFGNVSPEDFHIPDDLGFEDAEALILYDEGSYTYSWRDGSGFRTKFERLCRVKIENTEGFDWASHEIPLYTVTGTYKENLTNIKGFTHILENGKVKSIKLDKKDIFRDKFNDEYDVVKIALPNVVEGCIVEFTYAIDSEKTRSVPSWEFQKSIPVLWSEYTVAIPEFYNFQQLSQGYEPFYANIKTQESSAIVGSVRTQNSSMGQPPVRQAQRHEYKVNKNYLATKNLPALKNESFITRPEDFRLKLEHQIIGVQFPQSAYENLLGDWRKINEVLYKHQEFGVQIKSRGFYKNTIEEAKSKSSTDEELMMHIYKHVSSQMKWNGQNALFVEKNIKSAYDAQSGNAADINLTLISMLNAAGVRTDPVILSTRSNGIINTHALILKKYNYVVALAHVNGKKVLLDATDPFLPCGVLPVRCLNQHGRVVVENGIGDWINLTPQVGNYMASSSRLTISEEGEMQGIIQVKREGYNGLLLRQNLREKGEQAYKESLMTKYPGWKIEKMSFSDAEIGDGIIEEIHLSIQSGIQVMGNTMYIDPYIIEKLQENPFKNDERKLPVDMVMPDREFHNVNIEIPQGFTVDEVPVSTAFHSADKSASYRLLSNQNGNQLVVSRQYKRDRSFYSPTEYSTIREFYGMIVGAETQQIVLKKIPQ